MLADLVDILALPDRTPPDTVITLTPLAAVAPGSVTIGFDATETGSTFACALDDAVPSPCASPLTLLALAAGTHHLHVTATDPAGNADPTPADVAFGIRAPEVDAVAPGAAPAPATTPSATTTPS